jgi:mannosyltransferase
VIYNGVSDDYHVVTDIECNAQYGKFMLFVGSREVYKNFNLAVMASRRANMNLVIVGSRLTGKEIKFLEKELGKHRFFSLSGIPNSELNILYNQAHCFLYLSSYEGFGIPVLEAQKAGCPVITLDAPSVVEIIGDTTLVADTKDVDSIVEKIEMLSDESLRKTVIESGMRNAKKYNWDKMAEQVLVLYANAIKTKDLTSRINER